MFAGLEYQCLSVCVGSLGDVGVEALRHVLLRALLLRVLIEVLALLLPCHADNPVRILNALAEVYRGVLKKIGTINSWQNHSMYLHNGMKIVFS